MNLWLLEAGEGAGERIVREFVIGRCTLLYLKWITNKVVLFYTWNSIQCYMAAWMGEECGEEWILAYVWLSPFTVHQKLSQHCLLIGYTPNRT